MRLYEINAELESLLEQVDPETGELTCDLDALEALTIAREEKLEGLALAVKNYESDAAAIREEEKSLAERRKALENKAARAKDFLQTELNGETMTTPRVAVNYRSSKAVELGNEFYTWIYENPDAEDYIRRKEPEPDKTKISKALKSGVTIPGATLIERVNMTIK